MADQIDIKKIATLAALELTPAQHTAFAAQLEETLEYVKVLHTLKSEVEPTSQVTGLVSVTREDVVDTKYLLSQEEVTALASGKSYQGFIVVDQVIDAND